MSEQRVALIALNGPRTIAPDSGIYNFEVVDGKYGGLPVCQIPQKAALMLIQGTPHLFYPYYEEMDAIRHFKTTRRGTIRMEQAAKAIASPERAASEFFTGVDQTIPPDDRRGPRGHERFGPEDHNVEMPEIDPSSHVGIKAVEEEKDYPENARDLPSLPQSLGEIEGMAHAKKLHLIALYTGTDFDSLPNQHAKLNAMLLDIGRKHGHTYDVIDSTKGEATPTGDTAQDNPAADVGE